MLLVGKQWGYVEDTSARTISLQIALAKNLYCVVADESISASSLIKTTTSFTIYTSGAAWGRYAPQKFHWVAIGFQQWGILAASSVKWTYPMAFPTAFLYANCRAIRGSASGDGWSWFKSTPNKSYAEFLEKDEVGYCFAIGY